MKPVVYVGLSITEEEAKKVLDADYRPPVRRGDLLNLPKGTKVVGIIDGVILSDAAVGHREILEIMKAGITVIGGGSMGALRGSELKDYGMIGMGRVYEEYAGGRVDGDDEVLLAFDPFTHNPMSVPLINLRLNLRKAVGKGALDAGKADDILCELKALFYPMRNYEIMLDIARRKLSGEEFSRFEKFGKTEFEDFKKNDAILVLRAVKERSKNLKKFTPVKKNEKSLAAF